VGLCDAGTAEFRGVAETVPGLFEKSFKRPALCGVGLYDRHFAGEKYGEHSALNMACVPQFDTMHSSMSLGANFNDRNFDMEIFMVLCFIDFKLCGIISLFFTYLQRSFLSGG